VPNLGAINDAAINASFDGANVSGTLTGDSYYPSISATGTVAPSINGTLTGDSYYPAALISGFNNYSLALTEADSFYFVCDLIVSGSRVRVPIRTWQSTFRLGTQGYAQCVIYNAGAYADTIDAATSFTVKRLIVIDGTEVETEVFSETIERIDYSEGPSNYSCVIVGYPAAITDPGEPDPDYDVTLQKIRTIFSGTGGYRVRCKGDEVVRPGYRAYIDDSTSFKVDYVNYYAIGDDYYMDVGS
jgi:hypothetical protein